MGEEKNGNEEMKGGKRGMRSYSWSILGNFKNQCEDYEGALSLKVI